MKGRLVLAIVLGVMISMVLSTQPVAAGGEDAQMGDVEFTAVPATQGQGGPITLEAAVPFYAGCCYPLYAYDVSASLDTPMSIEVLSGPEPLKYSKVEAKAGGAPSWVTFTWVVRSMEPGPHQINVNVNSENAGTASAATEVTVTKGCVISIPEVYPEQAATNRDIYVNIEAMSPIEGVVIDQAVLYYTVADDELSNAESEGDTLYYGNGRSLKGKPISMDREEEGSTTWQVTIPKQDKASYMHYWVVATDNSGNETTSPVYVIQVEDMEYVDFVLAMAIWTPVLLMFIGITVIAYLLAYTGKVDIRKKGLLILGSSKLSKAEPAAETDARSLRRAHLARYTISGVLIVIGVAILLWAVMNNELADLINVMGGGV